MEVEVAVLGLPVLISLMVSVDVEATLNHDVYALVTLSLICH